MRNDALEEQIKDGLIHQKIVDIRDSEGESLGQSVCVNWDFDSYDPSRVIVHLTFEDSSANVLQGTQSLWIKPGSSENFVNVYTALLQLIDRKAPFYNLCMKEIAALRNFVSRMEGFKPEQCEHFSISYQP